MNESTLMVILAIVLSMGVLYLFCDRMSLRFSDTRFKNLRDYLLIFRKGLEILNARRWLVLIPLGIALFSLVVKFVFRLTGLSTFSNTYHQPFWGDFFFSGFVKSLDHIISQIEPNLIYTAVNAFFFVGPYNIQIPVMFYLPVAYALILLLGSYKINSSLNQMGDTLPDYFKNFFYPSIGTSILVLFIYATIFFEFYKTGELYVNKWLEWLAFLFGHLGLGGLFFAFFVGLSTYVVYQDYSFEWIYKPINWNQIFINAEQLLFFWAIVSFMTLPPAYGLIFPLWGKTFFTSLLFSFLPVLVSLLLMFVPMTIVIRKEKFVNSLLFSFSLWRVEYPRIIVFLIIAGVLSLMVNLLAQVLLNLPIYTISPLGFVFSTISLGLAVFVQIWVMTSWIGFFQKLCSDAKILDLDSNLNQFIAE